MKLFLGLILGFAIGGLCQLFAIPVPAPPVIQGAILVVAMTVGYQLMDSRLSSLPKSKSHCGGPTGAVSSSEGE